MINKLLILKQENKSNKKAIR